MNAARHLCPRGNQGFVALAPVPKNRPPRYAPVSALPALHSMSHEVWLRPNRRPALMIMIVSAVVVAVALSIVVLAAPWQTTGGLSVAVASASLAVAAAVVFVLAWRRAARPRVSRRESRLILDLGPADPTEVPLEVVEAFFLGQGPVDLPGRWGEQLEAVNLVARVSQRATEWHRRDVDPRVGAWCDGYITIRGTHCEPLDVETAHRLNRLLASAKREGRAHG